MFENKSRHSVIDKFLIGITYDTGLEKTRRLIKKIGHETATDPEFAPTIPAPLFIHRPISGHGIILAF
ncbi:hypothetical protein [Microvirga aerophila]